MKTSRFSQFASSSLVLLSLLTISDNLAQGQTSLPFAVGFWYPTNGQTFTAPANVGVHAWVVDSNLVQSVQYFAGTNSIGTVIYPGGVMLTNTGAANPFFLLWSNVPAGSYTLTAVATDAANLTATSPPVNITVLTPPPVRPSVYIYSPANGAMFLAPTNLMLYARAVENTGIVQTVEFFAGSTSLGVVPNSNQGVFTNISKEPLFPLAWSNVLAGSYALKAVATDAHGMTATSSVVNISVVTNLPLPPPARPSVYIYSPASGSLYLAPANLTLYARAVETTGTVQTVEFFAGNTSLGVVSNSSQVVVSNLSSAPLFPLAWPNVGAGNYALKAVATDAQGLTATSSVVNISVVTNVGNLPLAVRLLSPTNGQTYTALARIAMYAEAVDSNVVQTVQFFAGTTSLGTVSNTRGVLLTNWSTANSFSIVWSNVTPGSYPLTAVAVDTAGVMATSPPVNITVLWPPPPVVSMAYPTNGQTYYTPTSIGVHARVADLYAPVLTMQYFANGTCIGIVTNTQGVMVTNLNSGNPFYLNWSNVTAGVYALTAVATDSLGLMGTSAPVTITVIRPPPTITLYSPTNGQSYYAPANITLNPRVMDLNAVVQTVQYFANGTSIGLVSNKTGVMLTNLTSSTPFYMTWSNIVAGTYILTALATDAGGYTGTSAPVTITVVTRPPPNIPLAVGFLYPTNGQTFTAPANIGLHAWVVDSNVVRTVQYFANSASIGIVSNTAGVLLTNTTSANPFFLLWSNVPAGGYALTAVATDTGGNVATSAPVNIYVLSPPPPTNRPPEVRITSPPNAAVFRAPVNIPIYAYARDPDGYVASVEFLAGTNSLGYGSPILRGTNPPPTSYYTNIFFLIWSNALPGPYALTARATDNSNAFTVSLPVNITILPPSPPPPTNHTPTVVISAIDPIAIEGTNCWFWWSLTNTAPTWTNWPGGTRVPLTNCGPKNATFGVYRCGDTNSALMVTYAISGTASNGVDYDILPGVVTIPAGQRLAMIPVVPIDDGPPDLNSTVILKLTLSTNAPPAYFIGSPASAAALILDLPAPTPVTGALPDRTFHLNAAGPNGAWFHVEYSTDMLGWTPICTNQVVNGSVDFIDPRASTAQACFYRAVPEPDPPL